MAENKLARDRVRSLSVIMGTAFQRAALRGSNFGIGAFALAAILVLPEILTAPILLASLLLFTGNTFLGATDEELLDELLDDLGEEHQKALPASTKDSTSNKTEKEGRLKGRGRELYQRLVKCRKELAAELDTGANALPGLDREDIDKRMDELQTTFRALAMRRGQFENLLAKTSVDRLLKEADELSEQSAKATSSEATEDFARAAAEKRVHAKTMDEIAQGVENIEAKLQHILSSMEGYRAHIAALCIRDSSDDETSAENLEHIVRGLTEEAEDLERLLEVLGR